MPLRNRVPQIVDSRGCVLAYASRRLPPILLLQGICDSATLADFDEATAVAKRGKSIS
jgi:hypothetical protein